MLACFPSLRCVRSAVGALAWGMLLSCVTSAAPPEKVAQPLAPLDAKWNQELEAFAVKSESLQRPDLAQRCRALMVDRDKRSTRLYLAPRDAPTAPVVDPVERSWQRHLGALRQRRGDALFRVARQVAAEHPAWALQLCYEAVHLAPESNGVRQVLGYKRRANGSWHRGGFYGNAPTFHRGIRATVSKQRANPRLGLLAHWRIRTAHFEILAETSLESGELLAREVEAVFDAWSQLFAALWIDGKTLERRLRAEAAATPPLRRHRVVLFRDRQRYVEQLQRKEPRIQMSVGYYRPDDKTSYFYWEGDHPPIPTWRHEVTHQLFAEVRRAAPNAGLRQNFWLIEGIAMYMESLRTLGERRDVCLLGGPGVDRLQFARLRQSPDEAALQQLVTLGRVTLQSHPDLRQLYSSAAGAACFLMDGEQSRYRQACVKLLSLVYQGRDAADSLFTVTRIPDAEAFAKRYRVFLGQFDDQDIADLGPVENLCLRYTNVTGAGVRAIEGRSLRWLDAAGQPYGDDDLLPLLANAPQLRQLNLEATPISDNLFTSANLAQRWPQLVELDLSQTQVTDATVKQLAALRLQVLWLTKTSVSAKAADILCDFKSLTMLDVGGVAALSDDAVRRLKAQLPNLKQP